MKTYTAVIERDPESVLHVGYVPGFPGAHSQGESLDELQQNLAEVVAMLLEDGEPRLDGQFVGTQTFRFGIHRATAIFDRQGGTASYQRPPLHSIIPCEHNLLRPPAYPHAHDPNDALTYQRDHRGPACRGLRGGVQ